MGDSSRSLSGCAERLSVFLQDLRLLDPLFFTWCDATNIRNKFRLPFPCRKLEQFLQKGVNRREDNKTIILDLGFAVSLLPEGPFSGLILRIRCGCYSPWVANCCSLTFPREGETADRMICVTNLVRLAKTIIQNWQPEYGVITSHQCSELLSPTSFDREVGWITYLPKRYSQIPPSSPTFLVEKVEDGHLITINTERFSVENPSDMQALHSLASQLGFR